MNTMSLMRRFTIRFRMMGAIAMVLLLLVLVGAGGLWGMARIQGLNDTFMQQTFLEIQKFSDLQEVLGQVRLAEKDMVIQYEKPAEVEKAYARWKEQLALADKVAKGFLEGEEDADNPVIRKVLERLKTYTTSFEGIATQLKASGYDSATVANRLSAKSHEEMSGIDKLLREVGTILQNEANESVAEQKATSVNTQRLFIAALVVAMLLVVPLTILNMNSIVKPLEQARSAAQGIAGGDLSQRMRVEGGDEAADLLRALMSMQDGLGAMVAKVRDTSESVALASQEIASGNQDLSQRTEQTANSVQNTVTSLSELTGSVQQSATAAQTANQLSAQVSVLASRSGQVVTQAMGSMQDISTSSHKIGDIIGLIDSIAFQTNILALNAAVEAARAGEQGRGFAVVASEVRALAQRSASAANEIKGLISTSVAAVDGGVRLVQEASTAMQEMVAGVQRVGQIIGEISASSSEQSQGIGAVNQSVGDIDQMTQQNAALVEQSAAAAESLREQAELLSGVVRQFRLTADAT